MRGSEPAPAAPTPGSTEGVGKSQARSIRPPRAAEGERETRLDLVIPGALKDQRLDQVLTTLAPPHSRSQVQRFIREGRVWVDEVLASRAGAMVRGGEHVVVSVPAPAPAAPRPQALPLVVLYEDADLIVVDKPAGMVVHPAAGHAEGTLVNALLHHVGDLSGVGGQLRPGIVHRLDKGTSGVMVVAKHDRAHQELSRQFADREVDKQYVALVWGLVHAGRRIDASIGRDPHHRQRMSTRAHRARDAATRIVNVEPLRGVTLARIGIATGRTHQIRVHMQAIGHPIVGDALYGGSRRHLPLDLRILSTLDRPFLHAASISFVHPTDRRRMTFEAPLSADLQRVIDRLRAGVA
jgi:23S rRNA pseudouridine1911/1915/1917 synthase